MTVQILRTEVYNPDTNAWEYAGTAIRRAGPDAQEVDSTLHAVLGYLDTRREALRLRGHPQQSKERAVVDRLARRVKDLLHGKEAA
jgi:hypothetical protein